MRADVIRGIGLALSVCYGAFISWLYINQPQSAAEVTGGLSASIGAYRVEALAFEDGLRMFRSDDFAAARTAFERADPAQIATALVASMHFPPRGALSCASCHNNKRAFGGDDFQDCRRCHRGGNFKFS